jgi:caffeoyl-CoA O-methyltransferase
MAVRSKFIALNDELYDYVVAHGQNDDPVLQELAAETEKLGAIGGMQVSPEQGTFMGLLARAIGARSAVEVGTFTGYSAICVARALPPDGRLLCCDISEEWTSIARRYWHKAGVARKITLKLGPAAETLRELPPSERFDFAFIDADKPNNRSYYEEILARLRPNGLILVDNVIWGGDVIRARPRRPDTDAVREFNDFIVADRRVEAVMLPLADGLTIARKK